MKISLNHLKSSINGEIAELKNTLYLSSISMQPLNKDDKMVIEDGLSKLEAGIKELEKLIEIRNKMIDELEYLERG